MSNLCCKELVGSIRKVLEIKSVPNWRFIVKVVLREENNIFLHLLVYSTAFYSFFIQFHSLLQDKLLHQPPLEIQACSLSLSISLSLFSYLVAEVKEICQILRRKLLKVRGMLTFSSSDILLVDD